jgi:hypothetical protein
MPRVRIRYVAGVCDEDGDRIPVWKQIDVETAGTKRYHNNLTTLTKLSPAARNLLDYLAERMDHENVVGHTKKIRQQFLELVAYCYADITIKKAFVELKEAGILLPINRGTYRVNPEYFWRKDERKRQRLLKKILEQS